MFDPQGWFTPHATFFFSGEMSRNFLPGILFPSFFGGLSYILETVVVANSGQSTKKWWIWQRNERLICMPGWWHGLDVGSILFTSCLMNKKRYCINPDCFTIVPNQPAISPTRNLPMFVGVFPSCHRWLIAKGRKSVILPLYPSLPRKHIWGVGFVIG